MILITGAGGNSGGEVLTQAVAAGQKVRAAYQSVEKARRAPVGVEAAVVDFYRPDTLHEALQGIERVFLVGPAAANLAELEARAMDAIRGSDVRHVVKLSAMGPDDVSFPRLHRESEEYIRRSGVPYTFIRANGFMQNLLVYNVATIREQGAFYGCQGDGRVSLIDLRDIAAVAVKTLMDDGHEGMTYTVTGPEAITNSRVAEILSEVLGRVIRYVDLPEQQVLQALMAAGTPEWSANSIAALNRLYREGGASEVSADVERITGRPARPFAEFARDYAGSF